MYIHTHKHTYVHTYAYMHNICNIFHTHIKYIYVYKYILYINYL